MVSIDLFVCKITIGEIELGIERRRAINPGFAQLLANWLDVTLRAYGERMLPLTVAVARRCGRLAAKLGNKRHTHVACRHLVPRQAALIPAPTTRSRRSIPSGRPTGAGLFPSHLLNQNDLKVSTRRSCKRQS